MMITPLKSAFMAVRLVPFVLGLAILFAIVVGVFPVASVVAGGGAFFFVMTLLAWGWVAVLYKKRRYEYSGDKITQNSGTLVSDHENELLLKNVTHVSLRLPFIQYKIFGTGIVRVESAGSATSEVHFVEVAEPRALFQKVQEDMKAVGISLDTGELLSEERPHRLAIFFEVFRNFIVSLFFFFYIFADFFDEDTISSLFAGDGSLLLMLIASVVVGIIVWQFFVFLDLQKRVYQIYRHVVIYSEGFLSKNYTIIPYQNLADTEVTQTLIDKIFGLHDVKVSGKGAGHEILFKNLANGQNVSKILDQLIGEAQHDAPQECQVNSTQTEGHSVVHVADRGEKRASIASDFTHSTRPDLRYYLVLVALGALIALSLAAAYATAIGTGYGMILGVVAVIAIFFFLAALLYVRTRHYDLKERALVYEYNFITRQTVEFNFEKVTGVMLRQSFFQKWLHVAHVDFWSIGSHSVVRFHNIRDYNEVLVGVSEKFHFEKRDAMESVHAAYSILEWCKSQMFFFVVGTIFYSSAILLALFYEGGWLSYIIGIGIVHFFIVFFVQLYNIVYYRFSRMHFFTAHAYFQKGFLVKEYYFVPYHAIKDIAVEQYPFSQEGTLRCNVAGEELTHHKNRARFGLVRTSGQPVFSSHGFTIAFVENLFTVAQRVNTLLRKHSEGALISVDDALPVEEEAFSLSRPHARNILIPVLCLLLPIVGGLTSVFLFLDYPIIIFLLLYAMSIFIVGYILVDNYYRSYEIASHRVIARSGIFYKKEISIIFERINFINKNQSFAGKIFGNGNVSIQTIGSNHVEMLIRNIPDYAQFYESVQERYEQS